MRAFTTLALIHLVASAVPASAVNVFILEPGRVDYRDYASCDPALGDGGVHHQFGPDCPIVLLNECDSNGCDLSYDRSGSDATDDRHARLVVQAFLEEAPTSRFYFYTRVDDGPGAWKETAFEHASHPWPTLDKRALADGIWVRTDGTAGPSCSTVHRPNAVAVFHAAGNNGYNGIRDSRRWLIPESCGPDAIPIGRSGGLAGGGSQDFTCYADGLASSARLSCASNASDALEFVAPGCLSSSPADCGTSFSAPRVAGIVAREFAGQTPTRSQVLTHLRSMAVTVSDCDGHTFKGIGTPPRDPLCDEGGGPIGF